MDFYDSIVHSLSDHGGGVQKSKQTDLLKLVDNYDYSAACTGLSSSWLIAQKRKEDFSGIQQMKYVNLGATIHNRYRAWNQKGLDEIICNDVYLSQNGLEFFEAGFQKFSDASINTYKCIAAKILNDTCQYFLIAFIGIDKHFNEERGHRFAAYRPDKKAGDQRTFIYDPNVGEFYLKDEEGIKLFLQNLMSHGYNNYVNVRFSIRPYKG